MQVAITTNAVGVTHRSPGSRRSRAPWVGLEHTVTPKELNKTTPRDWLCNAFGVIDGFLILSQGAPLDKLGATLGYGVKPLRGIRMLAVA
jgi:hypothetical protein